MPATTTSPFDLPDRLAVKANPAQIADDERQFTAIASALSRTVADLSARLDEERRAPARSGQRALDRDQEVRRLSSRLRALSRYGVDLCLGRMVPARGGDPVYVGRFGLTDDTGRRLLVDWRSPAAEPFFGATHANPMGLESRRRYRWTRGRITDYWDEVFSLDSLDGHAALDDESAFIASLATARSSRMRDVLGTIQADQDAIIRAGSRGCMVVDGGPGTGKTVVALHRTAYLLYSDARLSRHHGGVLFVGPSAAYLAYIDDVLPSLGEDGVRVSTLSDLVPEGGGAVEEADPRVAALKSSARLLDAVDRAVDLYERPPTRPMMVETEWADVRLGPDDWADAFAAAAPGAAHDDARDDVWEELLDILVDRHDDEDAPQELVRRVLQQDAALRSAFARAWPLLDPAGVVADLWSVPAFLARCAPWLTAEEIGILQRDDARAWTRSDLPFLDAARRRIGDPAASRRRQREGALLADERERMSQVIDDLIQAEVHDDGEGVMTILRGEDARNSLIDEAALEPVDPDLLAGPFAHIVVDEAQELTDAEWQMLLARCPSRSATVVGDRAQARHGFRGTWQEHLARIGLDDVTVASLSVNYRTPSEVMAEAEPVIRAVLPDANVPLSIRSSGIPVRRADRHDLDAILTTWLEENADGVACVIGDAGFRPVPRVQSLTAASAKGLEFDLVVLVDPELFGDGVEGAVDRYVAMTRATRQLVILTNPRP